MAGYKNRPNPLAGLLRVIGQDGLPIAVSQGVGLGVRQHDDVMLSYGYSRTAHYNFQLASGQYALITLTIPAGISHHAESRVVEAYNSQVDVEIIPNYLGALPAEVAPMYAFNQKGAAYDPLVKSIFSFRGTNIATVPITNTDQEVIDHLILRALTAQGSKSSSQSEVSSVTGRYYYEGTHVVLFHNTGAGLADISYRYNWHEF